MSFLIAIGGARGSGKSTIARHLGTTLRADIIHLGRIRSVLRSVPGHDPVLDLSVNKQEKLGGSMEILERQAELLRKAVDRVISECEERRAALVIEGTHCLPGLYSVADVHVILEVSNATLRARYGKDKWRGGTADSQSQSLTKAITRNYQLQGCLLELAVKHERGVTIIDAESLPGAFADIIRLLPARSIPRSSGADE